MKRSVLLPERYQLAMSDGSAKPSKLIIGVRKSAARFRNEAGKLLIEWPTGDLTTRIMPSKDRFAETMRDVLCDQKYEEIEPVLCLTVHFWRIKGTPVVEVLGREEWSYCPVRDQIAKVTASAG